MKNVGNILNNIESFNNTLIVRGDDGRFYIDSYKYPRVFEKHGLEAGYSVEIIHVPAKEAIMTETSSFKHAGKTFNGHVLKISFK